MKYHVLFAISFYISFLFARKTYNQANANNPDKRISNFVSSIPSFLLSFVIIVIISLFVMHSYFKPSKETTIESSEPIKKTEFVRQIGEPQKYEILKREDKSKRDTNRVTSFWISSPDAVDLASRAATVKKAAEDLQQKINVPIVLVYLTINKESMGMGYNLAIARYFSDGCQYSGDECDDVIWSVEATSEAITPEQIRILSEWYNNRKMFLDKENNLNEEKLILFLSKKLKIPTSEISLPYFPTEKVNPYISEEDEKDSISRMKALQATIKQKQKAAEKRKEEIELQFSHWDGSHRDLERRIKESMNDPDSYKHYKTFYFDHGKHITVITEFGGRNSFGGMVRNTISADYTINGDFIKTNE